MNVLCGLRRLTAVALLMGLWMTSSACVIVKIKGSGVSASQLRELDAFTAVSNNGTINADIVVGSEQRVEVTCDDNLLQHIRTYVEKNELIIDSEADDAMLDPGVECKVAIRMPSLQNLDNSGVGDVNAQGEINSLAVVENSGVGIVNISDITVDTLKLSNSGVGNVCLAGQANALQIENSGMGNIKAKNLTAVHVVIDNSGVGDVEVTATESVDIELSGTGSVRVAGDPASRSADVSGIGSVTYE